jgi:hypothetical protein
VCQIRPSILYADYAKTALADLFNNIGTRQTLAELPHRWGIRTFARSRLKAVSDPVQIFALDLPRGGGHLQTGG